MSGRYLEILALVTIFALSATKSENTIAALKKILNELNGQTTLEDKYDEHYNKLIYRPRYYNQEKSRHHERGSPNLMNVQTMNLFLKPNKRQREEAELKRMLRTDVDRMCTLTGRCGCAGTRCSPPPNMIEDNIADDIDRVVNEINKQLTIDDNVENRKDVDEELVKNKYDEDNGERDRKEEDDIRVKETDRYDVDEGYERVINKLDEDDNLLQNKRIKIDDDIDVVILDKSDLDILLRNKDFHYLTRYHDSYDNAKDVDRDKDIFQKILAEYKQFVDNENKGKADRSSNYISPEDLFGHYDSFKNRVISKILNYVNGKKSLSHLPLEHLTAIQKQKLGNLKVKFSRGEIEEKDLEEKIVQIIFGEESDTKILAHSANNNHIYVPQWLYAKLISVKNNHRNDGIKINLREQKRILPLTSQQKDRLFNKEKAKTIPKLVWRKNFKPDIRRLGIPFDLEVHGLGQVAP